MDSIQSYKNFEKTPSLQRLGKYAFYRSRKAQSSSYVTQFSFIIYRKIFVPVLHAFGLCGCRFVPSCSHYAEHLLQESWSFKNFTLVVGRLLRCNAWTTPVLTFDPPAHDYILKNKI